MKTWITADWHLGEDRFQLMQRPFTSREQMVDTIKRNFNDIVAPKDHVIVVGDVCYQKAPEFLKHVADFNGVKTLIRGNHDNVFTDDQLLPYFDDIIEDGGGVDIKVGDLDCYVTHYPSCGAKNRFNLVGHIHSAWKFQLNAINIGVDVNHFRPVDLDEQIPFAYKAITEFYDRDVWTAYDQINEQFRDTRGKKTSYFTAK